MGAYAVDGTELRAADGLLQQTEIHARASLAGLSSTAEQLLGGRWSGPAAAAFRLGWADWFAAAEDALDALTALRIAVGLAGQGYDNTESAVQASVAGTRS